MGLIIRCCSAKPVKKEALEEILRQWLEPSTKTVETEADEAPMQTKNMRDDIDIETWNGIKALAKDRFPVFLAQYFSDAERYLQQIAEAIESKDFKTLESSAHPLKSSSGQIGAHKLADTARTIEHTAASAASG